MNSGSGIRVCRWSPDGTKIATAGDDERTTLWDVNNMEELWYMFHVLYIYIYIYLYQSKLTRISIFLTYNYNFFNFYIFYIFGPLFFIYI